MLAEPDSVLEDLRAATLAPSLIQQVYTTERVHTQALAAALNSKKAEARYLAAALWNSVSTEKLRSDQIVGVLATPEYALKSGLHSVIDMFVEIKLENETRQLAVEVKVDGMPYAAQLASMGEALGVHPHRHLVLLSLGAAQASRIEPNGGPLPALHRWYAADLLDLADLIIAASPQPNDAQAWLKELRREQARMERAWTAKDLTGCGYRGRLLTAYRYKGLATRLASPACWEVSLQTHGVVLHGKSSHFLIPGTKTTMYLELADDKLRVKAGSWYDESDARAAAEALIPLIKAAMTKHGLAVKLSKRTGGRSVSVLTIDPNGATWPIETLVERLQRAHAAWQSIEWQK